MGNWLGKGWAQPVTSKPWAFVASTLFTISKISGYRLANAAKGFAWRKACGV